ncbi:MAG: oligosaccharide flippase family protein [Gammaproteobacteria bacterium]|nr:oligosaccharide flippase family protein [Gammaproteobacteria bacterium]MBU2158121.1 oligosaccharide flippase family protein [Gammaproteobacteria bacterium]MBU2255737.1 oligosaccharide flippase family protein [Gammaproteobacteria bacterium]MBU2295347.1 oligosaccharide flippase family protein [Gammaproteobacteria bacterium]
MLKTVIRDSLIYGLASILSRGLAIFLLPIYTRVLSPADYGVYDLLVTLVALANLVVALEVSQGLARYWADNHEGAARVRFASTALWFTAGMYLLVCGFALLFAEPLTALLTGDVVYVHAFRLGMAFIALNGLYYLVLNQFRWELRSREFAVISLGYALLTLGFALLFCLVLDLGLEGVLLAQIAATLIGLLAALWRLRSSFRPAFDVEALQKMLVFSLPLVPSGIAIFTSLYINRFALIQYASIEEVGIYGLATRVAGLITLLILGVQAALTPLVYQHANDPETPGQIARLFSWFAALALLGCLGLGLLAGELVQVFATADYASAAPLVFILAPAMLLSQMYVFAPGIGIRKKTLYQLGVTLLAAAVSVLANWLLVPAFGMPGAAWATLLSSAVFLWGWFWVSQRLYPVPYAWRQLALGLLAFLACVVAGRVIGTLSQPVLLALVVKAVVLMVLALMLVGLRLVSVTELQAGYRVLRDRFRRS